MKRVLLLYTLLSVCALSLSSLSGHNNYGAHHSGNSLNYRGSSSYSGPHHHGPSLPRAPSAPYGPSAPHSPSYPQSPRLPHAPRAPVSHPHGAAVGGAYGARTGGYGSSRNVGVHHVAPPVHYGGGRHFSPAGSSVNEYHHAPAPYGAGPVPYAGPVHASAGNSHYASSKRSVYQHPQEHQSYNSRSGFPHQQNYAHSQQNAQSTAQAHGREMKYTIRDPHNRGTTHVTETHVVSNRQMHGAEAEAAMKKLMGSMGPTSNGGFDDIFKGMGLPFY